MQEEDSNLPDSDFDDFDSSEEGGEGGEEGGERAGSQDNEIQEIYYGGQTRQVKEKNKLSTKTKKSNSGNS